MKFLTFTDLHEDKGLLKDLVERASKKDIDFIVCCGDISSFGRGLRYNLTKLNSVGKKVLVIPGNHEEGKSGFNEIIGNLPNCINLDRRAIKIGDYVFLGYGGGGFSMQDAEFRKISREWYGKYKDEKIILVTHGPPYDTELDKLEMNESQDRHVGNKDYRKFIERIKPMVAISGHLHETVGKSDKIGNTKLINPGWDGMVVGLK